MCTLLALCDGVILVELFINMKGKKLIGRELSEKISLSFSVLHIPHSFKRCAYTER